MNREVRPGLEVLLDERLQLVHGASIGLVTNPTGVDRRLQSTADLFAQQPGVTLSALFGPEHGVGGAVRPAGHRLSVLHLKPVCVRSSVPTRFLSDTA